MGITVLIPESLIKKAKEKGIAIEDLIIELLTSKLGLDPKEEAELHLELAKRYLREGEGLIDRDPIQASEKLYKVAEECVKAVAKLLRVEDVVKRVRERGRWVLKDLEYVAMISKSKLGESFYIGWDMACFLHVWGFHEAKLDPDSIRSRLPYIKRMVSSVEKLLCGSKA